MPNLPSYDQLAVVDRAVLCSLLDRHGTPAWTGTYEHRWGRYSDTWTAVEVALNAAAVTRDISSPDVQPPRWLLPLVRETLSLLGTRWQQGGQFGEVRLLERLGLVTLEPDDAYVLALVGGLGHRWNSVSRADQLRTDPELLERLWRVFEVEGGGEVSLTNIDKYASDTWRLTFCELLADGTLERDRVLTCCLQALQRDFSSYRAGWFSQLHNVLAPTLEEMAARQGAYRNLLRSQVTATVTLAARCLKQVNAAGHLDDEEFEALRAGLHARTKGAALDTLRLLSDIAARRPEYQHAVAALAHDAVEHPQRDVQRAAVALLTTLDAAAAIDTDSLAPTVQRSLGRKPSTAPLAAASPSALRALPASVTAADVVERAAGLLEDASDPQEVEAVIAGLASLRDPVRLRPLTKRARAILQRGPREGVAQGWLRGHVAQLILSAAGEHHDSLPSVHPRAQFLARRLHHVQNILTGRVAPGALLATPTLPGGYLDPRVLVARLAAQTSPASAEDLIAAVLRLGTEGRAEALQHVTGDDATSQAIRHALGAPRAKLGLVRPGSDLDTPALWVAAARVREPGADDQLLLQCGLERAGQGRSVHASLGAVARSHSWRDRRGEHHSQHWTFATHVPHGSTAAEPQQPTVAISAVGEPGWQYNQLEDWVPWILASTPHDIEAALTELIHPVLRAMTGNEVEHDATRVLDALAYHPGRVGFLAAAVVAAGLASYRPDHRLRAADVILAWIEADQLSVADLAAGMRPLAPAAPPGRWASSLASIAQARPDDFVADVLTRVLPAVTSDQHGLHALVELLLEESIRIDRPPTDAALKDWLVAVSGQGKAARAARELLTL